MKHAGRPREFELYQGSDGKWRWRTKAANGWITGDGSEGYSTRSNARIALLKLIRDINNSNYVITTLKEPK